MTDTPKTDALRDNEVSRWNSPSFEHLGASSLRASSFHAAIDLAKHFERQIAWLKKDLALYKELAASRRPLRHGDPVK